MVVLGYAGLSEGSRAREGRSGPVSAPGSRSPSHHAVEHCDGADLWYRWGAPVARPAAAAAWCADGGRHRMRMFGARFTVDPNRRPIHLRPWRHGRGSSACRRGPGKVRPWSPRAWDGPRACPRRDLRNNVLKMLHLRRFCVTPACNIPWRAPQKVVPETGPAKAEPLTRDTNFFVPNHVMAAD